MFDANCPSRKGGPSLNVVLHAEPWNFRSYNCTIISDIEKAFLQIILAGKQIIQDLFGLKM